MVHDSLWDRIRNVKHDGILQLLSADAMYIIILPERSRKTVSAGIESRRCAFFCYRPLIHIISWIAANYSNDCSIEFETKTENSSVCNSGKQIKRKHLYFTEIMFYVSRHHSAIVLIWILLIQSSATPRCSFWIMHAQGLITSVCAIDTPCSLPVTERSTCRKFPRLMLYT